MVTRQPTVFVVDDDEAVRNSLSWLIQSVGLRVETYPDAQGFLDHYRAGQAGCLILDVRLPGMSGLELQSHLAERRLDIPVIVISGHGDVPMAVRAMRAGAVNFIEKPFSDQALLDEIQRSIEQDAEARAQRAEATAVATRLALLTPREHEVLDLVVSGLSTKQIAHRLTLADKTVEAHRAHLMSKMQARSVAHLVRLAMSVRPPVSDSALNSSSPGEPPRRNHSGRSG